MSARKTRCFTYGEDKRQHETFTAADGSRICVTMSVLRTACGKWVEADDDLSFEVPDFFVWESDEGIGWSRRPKDCCVACWHEWRQCNLVDLEKWDKADCPPRYRYMFDARVKDSVEGEVSP